MMIKIADRGSFTMPGEAGHEALTLRLARKWGADTIRDSDGTQLSPEIVSAGYDIYSTLCLVRSVNAWAKKHRDKLQQNFLMSFPVVADKTTVKVDLLAGFFREQFAVNTYADPKRWWQVHDRTTGEVVSKRQWSFDPHKGTVTIRGARRWHRYSVNFLAIRLWEEISMYNHITNDWGDREHLAAVDPIHPATQRVILEFLRNWLSEHPDTTVVRFTSMFYNFSWFWGDDVDRLRYVYSDWGDYAMTVSPRALNAFSRRYGYRLTSEDFVNGGLYNSTHNAPTRRYRDYMEFIHGFVADFGRQCVDLVHKHGKKAFVFYDDHWIGVEPYGPRFRDFGFDGIIKCVFNAFEVRKCAGVPHVATRELRLHPYLFPTGLKGEPTFLPGAGGNPTQDAKNFWIAARRGILRAKIDRIGLGGYLSLVEPWPDFQDYIKTLAKEFRLLKSLHDADQPYTAPCRVGVLTAWGRLRSWIASGHFYPGVEYNELLESLAGLPLDVRFVGLDEIASNGVPKNIDVLVNCGREGSAWSGGHLWEDPEIPSRIAGWMANGGGFVGIGEPSAVSTRRDSFFQLSSVLGVDRDRGDRIALSRRKFAVDPNHFITADLASPLSPDFGHDVTGVFLTSNRTEVHAAQSGPGPDFIEGSPTITTHSFKRGRSVYLSGFKNTHANARLIHRAIHWAAAEEKSWPSWSTSNVRTECGWFPTSRKLVVINNSGEAQTTKITLEDELSQQRIRLRAHGIRILDL